MKRGDDGDDDGDALVEDVDGYGGERERERGNEDGCEDENGSAYGVKLGFWTAKCFVLFVKGQYRSDQLTLRKGRFSPSYGVSGATYDDGSCFAYRVFRL